MKAEERTMYLKSIEVHGFKAFANKIRFEFDGGITGIVGPNGSGKSNVADAVRWVLGEQSAKQLRGSSMQDVIFSGTESRKPMGFAYVSLTLDNSDHKLPVSYDEVTVGRRVYRSGESEYLLNGVECRLRDVQELFFDTGIGKEGYSIIGQGQIDKILSGKPEERREIFDEAAGITKVKKRKLQTEKSLEEERQNLARVNDIVTELEGRIGPLEKQYEKALVYLKYKEELKAREVNQFLMEYEKNSTVKEELDSKLKTVSDDLTDAQSAYEQAKTEYDTLYGEAERKREQLAEAKERRANGQVELEKTIGERNVLGEQITAVAQKDAQTAEQLDKVQQKIAEKEEELAHYFDKQKDYDEQLKELGRVKEQADELLGEMKANINAMLLEEQQYNASHIACIQADTDLKTELERNNTLLEQYAIKRAETNAKLLRFKEEADEAKRQVDEAEEALKTAVTAVSDASEAYSRKEARVKELSNEIADADKLWEQKKKRAIEVASKMETMKNLVERYDGYAGTVRKVMEQKKQFPGIHGVVADIIQVDARYETAIETALGGNIQNVVTDSTDTAKALIQYLKTNHLGRATFIPLSDIRAKKDEFETEVFTKKGVIGIAASLVETDERYREAIAYLLGRFLVVDTIDHAIAIEKQYKQKLRIVTLEGELFQPGGAVSGGAFKSNSNLLGRRREVEELEEADRVCREEAEVCGAAIAKFRKEREQLRNELELGRTALQELMVAQNTAKMNLDHIMEQNKGLLNTREVLVEEVAAAEAECERIKENNRSLQEQIEENALRGEQDRIHAEEIHNRMETLRSEEDAASAEAVRVLTEYTGLKQSVGYQRDNGERLNREIHTLKQEEQELKDIRKAAAKEAEEKQAGICELENTQKRLEQDIQTTEEEIETLGQQVEAFNGQNKELFEKREELSRSLSLLDKEQFRLQNQKEKLDDQLDSQTHYMWEEYQLTYTQAAELRSDIYDNSVLNRKAIYELKNQIRELGNVNVNAIEEYRETKERYEFLSGQRDDISKAEQTLTEIIASLDEEMRKQFTDTFEQLKVRFDSVFKELFDGGKATLSLSEDEDILEAGILITVQPPRKKLQNMMQLSGGEKALTAISLLFAILDLRPSPFCLLDEIEAALDDSNVSRFAQYLHKLTKDTQFIVITHRRGTMAAADALYGITMQEKGVSTLVSVNLIENELDA